MSRKAQPKDTGNINTCFVTGRDGKSGGSRLQYAVNLRLVLASQAIGVGYFQVQRFFGILGIGNFMHSKTFQYLNKKLHEATKHAANQNLKEVHEKVKGLYEKENIMEDTANTDDKNSNTFTTPLKPGDIGIMYEGT